jgi:hypothetical protein
MGKQENDSGTFADFIKNNVPGLVEGDNLIMPSFSEAMGYMNIADAINVESLIERRSQWYKKFVSENKFDVSPNIFTIFVIPLDSYIPLPEPYDADFILPAEPKKILRAYLSTTTSFVLEVKHKDKDTKIRYSFLTVAIGGDNVTDEDFAKSGGEFTQFISGSD